MLPIHLIILSISTSPIFCKRSDLSSSLKEYSPNLQNFGISLPALPRFSERTLTSFGHGSNSAGNVGSRKFRFTVTKNSRQLLPQNGAVVNTFIGGHTNHNQEQNMANAKKTVRTSGTFIDYNSKNEVSAIKRPAHTGNNALNPLLIYKNNGRNIATTNNVINSDASLRSVLDGNRIRNNENSFLATRNPTLNLANSFKDTKYYHGNGRNVDNFATIENRNIRNSVQSYSGVPENSENVRNVFVQINGNNQLKTRNHNGKSFQTPVVASLIQNNLNNPQTQSVAKSTNNSFVSQFSNIDDSQTEASQVTFLPLRTKNNGHQTTVRKAVTVFSSNDIHVDDYETEQTGLVTPSSTRQSSNIGEEVVENEFNNDRTERRISQNNINVSSLNRCIAGFTVRKGLSNKGHDDQPARIFFQEVLTNAGQVWSENTQEFVAPCLGLYYFIFHAVSTEDSDFTVALMRNDEYQVTAYGGKEGYLWGSNSALLQLNPHDKVYIELQQGDIYEHPFNESYVTFTGYLVTQL